MSAEGKSVLEDLEEIVSAGGDRVSALQAVADILQRHGHYRWVGLYDVDRTGGMVTNIVWSGPAAPEYPTFPITRGLTGAAISQRKTVNVGDVATDPRYLTAFDTTRAEIIVPVFDRARESVLGTIDIESEQKNAFTGEAQAWLEACSGVIGPLWNRAR